MYKDVRPFTTYSLLLTEDCNLACTYCYEINTTGHKKSKMDYKIADQVLKFTFEEAMKEPNPKERMVSYSFFGGEPTLNMKIIDYLCENGKLLSKKHGIRFDVSIITNATNMNRTTYEIFKKHRDIFNNVQLSIDGHKDVQDTNRRTKSGHGSFDMIEKNIPYWKSLFGDCLHIHGVLSKASMSELFNSFIYFREKWNIPRIWFLPAKDKNYTEEDLQIYKNELNKIYEYIMCDVRKNNRVDEIQNYAPLDRSLRCDKSGKPCGAGDTYCTITSKGDIYPCHHLYYVDSDETQRETKLGDIWNGVDLSKKYMWYAYDNNDMIGCEECDHDHCYRCIAENYEEFKTPFIQIKGNHCKLMKIDQYFQNKIKKEITEMGLLNKTNGNGGGSCKCNARENDSCLCNVDTTKGTHRDCVGKIGQCDLVVSVDDCIFDRSNTPSLKDVPDFDDIKNEEINDDNCRGDDNCCGNDNYCGDDNCCGNCGDKEESNDNVPKQEINNMLNELIDVLASYQKKWF